MKEIKRVPVFLKHSVYRVQTIKRNMMLLYSDHCISASAARNLEIKYKHKIK